MSTNGQQLNFVTPDISHDCCQTRCGASDVSERAPETRAFPVTSLSDKYRQLIFGTPSARDGAFGGMATEKCDEVTNCRGGFLETRAPQNLDGVLKICGRVLDRGNMQIKAPPTNLDEALHLIEALTGWITYIESTAVGNGFETCKKCEIEIWNAWRHCTGLLDRAEATFPVQDAIHAKEIENLKNMIETLDREKNKLRNDNVDASVNHLNASVKANERLTEEVARTNRMEKQIRELQEENRKLNIRLEKQEETQKADPVVVQPIGQNENIKQLHPSTKIQPPQPTTWFQVPSQFSHTPCPASHFHHAGHIQHAANFNHYPTNHRDFNQSVQMRQAAKLKNSKKSNHTGKFNSIYEFKPPFRLEPISKIESEQKRFIEASKIANSFTHGPLFQTHGFKEFPQLARCFYNPEKRKMPQDVERIPKDFARMHSDKKLDSLFQEILEHKQREQERYGMVFIYDALF